MKQLLLCLLLCNAALQLMAQPNYPVPTGVYCSCGPTFATGTGSVDPIIAQKDFVKGILVRVGWNVMEPTNNSYNWAVLDTQIYRARNYGKKVALGFVNGPSAPQWLYNLGAQRAIIGAPFNDTIPYPWDSTYLAQWEDFIAAMGNHYANDTTITLIHMTNATANGFEFFLNPTSLFNWANVGYTDDKMIQSWKRVVNSFKNAFPNHYLDNDFHPIFLTPNSSNIPSDSIYLYATQTLGSQYGAFSSWWSQNNTNTYATQYADLVNSANNTFATVQLAYNGTTDSASFGVGGLPAAMQLAVSQNICYWEVWNQDILNPDFDSTLSNITCLNTGITEDNIINNTFNIYPNPATNYITIDNMQGGTIIIQNMLGKCMYSNKTTAENLTIPIDRWAAGLYIVSIKNNSTITTKKLVKSPN